MMRVKIGAAILLICVISFVSVNTIVLDRQIGDIIKEVEQTSISSEGVLEEAKELYADFMRKEKYMSLTVSHDDLTSIEDCFVEMIGYISVGDSNNAVVTKSRLISCLEHLRRLSGFNIDAVI